MLSDMCLGRPTLITDEGAMALKIVYFNDAINPLLQISTKRVFSRDLASLFCALSSVWVRPYLHRFCSGSKNTSILVVSMKDQESPDWHAMAAGPGSEINTMEKRLGEQFECSV